MQKPKQNVDENSEIQVKLKPFMGMRPGVYLTILYSFVLLIIMFFFLLYPGLKNFGSMLIVKSKPAGAAVRVNDVYMGVAGSKIFVPKGTHTIDIVMPGFEKQSEVLHIQGRVFATLFFPKIKRVEYTLKPADMSPDGIASAFALYAADFASWTFAGEATVAWQVPMSLSEGAYRLGQYADFAKQELDDILLAASRFAVTKAALRDIIRAKILIDGKGNAPSPITLLGSVSDALAFVSENPQAAKAMFELLPKETAKKIADSNWYKKDYTPSAELFAALDEFHNLIQNTRQYTRQSPELTIIQDPIRSVSFYGLSFTGGSISKVCETPVSRSLFENFLNENPEYREQKTDYFPNEISSLPEIDRNAVTGITWYAADAFCKWLSLRIPASMSNMEIRLPTENELSFARNSVQFLQEPAWEFCADHYAPLNINISEKAKKLIESPERTLFAVDPSNQPKRASLPPDLSSPFVTFRPVLAPKE